MSFWQGLYNVGPARDSERSQEPRVKGARLELMCSDRAGIAPGSAAPDQLVNGYLTALAAADATAVLALFADNAIVHSPLSGDMPAGTFYPALFEDTANSTLTLRTTMTGQRDGHTVITF